MINTQIQSIHAINTLIIINFFNCDVPNVVNIKIFVRHFCQFLTTLHENFEINYIVVKIISSIFNIHLLGFSHLYVYQIFISLRIPNLMQETSFLIKDQL